MSIRLALEGAGYRYAGAAEPALRNVSLQLLAGRVVGVVGPNESGKSTLCLVAAGLAPGVIGGRLDGSVRIDGQATTTLRPHEMAQRCGLLFENAATQLSHMTRTVFEEVSLGPCNLGMPPAEVVARVRWGLGVVGIEALAGRDPTRLSGGQSQLVALASVLALRPGCLILDEPTSELDPGGTRLVALALARIARETGVAIMVVEHKTDVLAEIADEIVVMDRGAVAVSGPAATVLADPRLADLGVDPPARVRLERAVKASRLDWSAALAGALE